MKTNQIIFLLAAMMFAAVAAHAQETPNGKALYDANCAACHSTGVAGAPKIGDAAAWKERLARGVNALVGTALKGKGAMPPKGGNASLTDAQITAAVNHLLGLSPAASGPAPAAAVARPAAKAPDISKGTPIADAGRGKLVYQATCAACHTSGLAGAPKLGDVAAWAARLSAGVSAVYANGIKGKGAMPPKGGNASLSDSDFRAAVDFILALSRGDAPQALAGTNSPGASSQASSAVAAASASPVADAQVTETADPNSFNRLMRAPSGRNRPPSEDGIHDPASPGTGLLQPPLRSFQALPRSNLGNFVDWVAALGKKQIQPRWDASDSKAQGMVMDLNIVREVKGSMLDVVFPHKQHTEWLDCANCHPAIFTPQKGSNQISMAAIMLGQKCGVCHGKVAFPISECKLCHSRQKKPEPRTADAQTVEGGKP